MEKKERKKREALNNWESELRGREIERGKWARKIRRERRKITWETCKRKRDKESETLNMWELGQKGGREKKFRKEERENEM